MIIWFTGQPAHGKTTLANMLHRRLPLSMVVDGDDLRNIYENKDYSEAGRRNNVGLAQKIAKFIHCKGRDAIVALVSPYRDMREELKAELGDELLEIYVFCDEPRERDHFHVKNYEAPEDNFIKIDTGRFTPEECIDQILHHL